MQDTLIIKEFMSLRCVGEKRALPSSWKIPGRIWTPPSYPKSLPFLSLRINGLLENIHFPEEHAGNPDTNEITIKTVYQK